MKAAILPKKNVLTYAEVDNYQYIFFNLSC